MELDLDHLQEAARHCCSSEPQEDSSAAAVREFVDILSKPVKAIDSASSPLEEHLQLECHRVLAEAKSLLDPATPSGLQLLDLVSLELPSILVKYALVSSECEAFSESIMATLCDNCNPRELFSSYMEALHLYATPLDLPFCAPLLRDLCKIFSRITRRRIGFFKELVPGLLEIARIAVGRGEQTSDLLDKLVQLATTVHNLCMQDEGEKQREMARHVLGVFVLQLLAIVCNDHKLVNMGGTTSLITGLCRLLSLCHVSCFDLLTGSYVPEICDFAYRQYSYGNVELQELKRGAMLAVYWELCHDKMTDEDMKTLQHRLVSSEHASFDALFHAKDLLVPYENSWHSVEMGVCLLLKIMKMHTSSTEVPFETNTEDWPEISLQMGTLLQTIEKVIIFAPNKELRQKAYSLLTMILCDALPAGLRFDSLRALIINSQHPSMVSLLLGCVKEEVLKALTVRQASAPKSGGRQDLRRLVLEPNSPFASSEVLNLIESILRPTKGGPPDLPSQIDAVLGALNLYRFVLIKETTGKSNYTGVASKPHLQKAYSQWLLPLREVLASLHLRFKDDSSDDPMYMLLALETLEGVLYRCLELVEEALNQCSSSRNESYIL